MLVKNDGHVQWTCSSKCKKNMRVLKRDPRKLKWTVRYVKGGLAHEKAIVVVDRPWHLSKR